MVAILKRFLGRTDTSITGDVENEDTDDSGGSNNSSTFTDLSWLVQDVALLSVNNLTRTSY